VVMKSTIRDRLV